MSAAEKLRALQERTDTGTALNYGRVAALNELEAALSQIVAVVEAAEKLVDSSDDDWFYGGGRAQTFRALAALDEALT